MSGGLNSKSAIQQYYNRPTGYKATTLGPPRVYGVGASSATARVAAR